MSRVPMGLAAGAWAPDPAPNPPAVPAAIGADLTLPQRSVADAHALRLKAPVPEGRQGLAPGAVRRRRCRSLFRNRHRPTDHDEFILRRPTPRVVPKPSFDDGADGADACCKYSFIEHAVYAGNSLGIVDGASAMFIGP